MFFLVSVLTFQTVDGPVTNNFNVVVDISFFLLVKLGLVVYISPAFIFPSVLMILIGMWCGNVYNKAVLPVKREMNNSRSPILAHFGAAIAGIGQLIPFIAARCIGS